MRKAKKQVMRNGGLAMICRDRSEVAYAEENYQKGRIYAVLSVIFENADNPDDEDIFWHRDENGIKREVVIPNNNKIHGLYKLGTNFLDPIPFLLGMNILCPGSVHTLICNDLNSTTINNIDDLFLAIK